MSSHSVRKKLCEYAEQYQGLTFYNSINSEIEPMEPEWFTLSFQADYSEQATLCGTMKEEGVVTVQVFGESGQGYDALHPTAEALLKYFHSYYDNVGTLTLSDAHVMNETPLQGQRWFSLSGEIDYTTTQRNRSVMISSPSKADVKADIKTGIDAAIAKLLANAGGSLAGTTVPGKLIACGNGMSSNRGGNYGQAWGFSSWKQNSNRSLDMTFIETPTDYRTLVCVVSNTENPGASIAGGGVRASATAAYFHLYGGVMVSELLHNNTDSFCAFLIYKPDTAALSPVDFPKV